MRLKYLKHFTAFNTNWVIVETALTIIEFLFHFILKCTQLAHAVEYIFFFPTKKLYAFKVFFFVVLLIRFCFRHFTYAFSIQRVFNRFNRQYWYKIVIKLFIHNWICGIKSALKINERIEKNFIGFPWLLCDYLQSYLV